MNRYAYIEEFFEYPSVKYYTVRVANENDLKDELSETDKFYSEFDNSDNEKFNEFEKIISVIDAIGHLYLGADSRLFRFENNAHALPPNINHALKILETEIDRNSTLRLYCIRLTNNIVVLLNGGVKTKDDAKDCPNVARHFWFANKIANKIDELIKEKNITLSEKEIVNNSDESEIMFIL